LYSTLAVRNRVSTCDVGVPFLALLNDNGELDEASPIDNLSQPFSAGAEGQLSDRSFIRSSIPRSKFITPKKV
jgi:hypothetical protein